MSVWIIKKNIYSDRFSINKVLRIKSSKEQLYH